MKNILSRMTVFLTIKTIFLLIFTNLVSSLYKSNDLIKNGDFFKNNCPE